MVTVSKDLPEGDGKKLVASRCVTCHDTERFVGFHMPRDRWAFTVRRMRGRMRTAKIRDLTADEAKLAIDYLSTNFPPTRQTDLNDRLPRTLLEGKALHYRAVQYDISDTSVGAEPHDVAVDPHGNGWVSQRTGKLGRLDPKTLEYTEVSIPAGVAADDGQVLGNLQIDAKGQLWVPDGPNYRWLDYDVNTGKFTSYDWPKDNRADAGGNSMLIHPNGSIWETAGNQVRMLNTATKEFKFFDPPSYVATQEPTGAYGITVAGDGSVWWAEDMADRMSRIDPATGKVEEYKIPFDGARLPAPHEPRRPRRHLGRTLERGTADEGRLRNQADDVFRPAHETLRHLFRKRGPQKQSDLGERTTGRQNCPLQSQDGRMGGVPASRFRVGPEKD